MNDISFLKDKLQFPLHIYVKENGFLGLLSYDEYANDFRFCSKSVIGGEYADWFKEIFIATTTEQNKIKILQYLKDNNATMAFEVIDIAHDPHIIEYSASKIVLLDIIKNQLEFEAVPYDQMCKLANDYGLYHKKLDCTIDNWDRFCIWYYEVQKEGYKNSGSWIEGFVVTDSEGFMFKVKTAYYNYWKRLRPIVNETLRKGYIEGTGKLTDETQNLFYGFLQKLWRETEDKMTLPNDIVTLRRMFYDEAN